MVRKRGLDVRNGNWVFYDDRLLAVESMLDEPVEIAKTKLAPVSPDGLNEILTDNEQVLRDAGEALHQKNGSYPWLHTVKLAMYADTFATGLAAEAEKINFAIDPNADAAYTRRLIREQHYPYLSAVEHTSFTWRVPGRMKGWNEARDGLWLQVMPREHAEEQLAAQASLEALGALVRRQNWVNSLARDKVVERED